VLTAASLLALAACAREAQRAAPPPPPPVPDGVVLLVGDGFGVGAWSLARVFTQGRGEELVLDRAEALGFLDTRCADEIVTDSAAAATAWATGLPGLVFRVGAEDPAVPNLFERMRAAGRSFGFVTTARVTHHTVSPFYARAPKRDAEDDLAVQLVEHMPDVAIGGGLLHFLPAKAGGARRDGRDLLAEAEADSVAVLRAFGELPADRPVLAVLASSHLPHVLDRPPGDPGLPELVTAAIRRLLTQAHCFQAAELSLRAQQVADEARQRERSRV
jgi:alkaline phosphatase